MRNKRLRAAFAVCGFLLALTAGAAAGRLSKRSQTAPESAAEVSAPEISAPEISAAETVTTSAAPAAETTAATTAQSFAPAVPEPDASDFVLLSDAVPDVILEMRYYTTYNFIGDRIDGYDAPCALLTKEAAAALRGVSDELGEKGYRLKIYDAYRPQTAVDHFVRWAEDTADIRMKACFYPELDKSVLFESGYISRHSAHSRGSTVDLTLFDISTGKDVDMGGTFDYFGERSHPDFRGVSQEQYANRRLLRDAMTSHGFHGISTEWWHFTLNDEPFPETFFSFPVDPAVLP